MKELIAIYREPDSLWMDACKWATDRGIERKVKNASCYRGMNYRATMFYADDESIVRDYELRGVRRLSDVGLIDGDEDE